MVDFYLSNRNYERVFNTIQANPKVSARNKKLCSEFLRFLLSRGRKPARIKKLLEKFYGIVRITNKDIDKLTLADIENFMLNINKLHRGIGKKELSETTKDDYKIVLKMLMRFVQKEKYNPEIYKGLLSCHVVKEFAVNRGDILTDEEINLLLRYANPMYRAIIAVQNETGMRPSELLSLNIGDLVFEKSYTEIAIRESKTKRRVNLAVISDPILREWVRLHPDRENKDAPLFVSYYAGQNNLTHLTPAAYNKTLKKIAGRAKIKKRVWPYVLRHTAILRMQKKGYTDSMLESIVGWVPGSRHKRSYSHLQSEDTNKYVLQKIKEEEQKAIEGGEELSYMVCPFCSARNNSESYYCAECQRPINLKAIQEIEQKRNKEIEDMKARLEETEEALKLIVPLFNGIGGNSRKELEKHVRK